MSRKPNFANFRDRQVPFPASASSIDQVDTSPKGPASREGRKQIAGFFTPEMSFAMHMLAHRQSRSLQELMAKAFNDVLQNHGESPIGDDWGLERQHC